MRLEGVEIVGIASVEIGDIHVTLQPNGYYCLFQGKRVPAPGVIPWLQGWPLATEYGVYDCAADTSRTDTVIPRTDDILVF